MNLQELVYCIQNAAEELEQREEMIFLNEIWNEIFDILGEEEWNGAIVIVAVMVEIVGRKNESLYYMRWMRCQIW